MCGLVGVAGNIDDKVSKAFRIMLLLDTIRGEDSTGVMAVERHSNTPITEKEIGLPSNLWDYGPSDIFSYFSGVKPNMKVLMGHNRAATLGAVNKENAHPFTFGNITGAHNGTLTDWSDLEDYQSLDVDSKGLFNTISLKGVEHTWKNFLGAAAITYWDSSEGTLNIVRNSQRPLYFAYSKDDKTLLWASEAFMISVAARKAGIELSTSDKNTMGISSFGLDTHFKFKVSPMSIDLVGEVVLEKKKLLTKEEVTHIGGSSTFGKTNRSHFKSPKKNKRQINKMWAHGLAKADKSVRGLEAKLIKVTPSLNYLNDGGGYVTMELETGQMLRVYPQSSSEMERYSTLASGKSDIYYLLNYRPRVQKTDSGTFVMYKVSSSGVRMVRAVPKKEEGPGTVGAGFDLKKKESNVISLFSGPEHPVTKEEWEQLLRGLSPSCSCSNCLNPLDMEEHAEILWLSKEQAFCPECANNAGVMQTITYSNLG